MPVWLEVFPNAALYRMTTRSSIVETPLEVSELVADGALVRLESFGQLTPGTPVTISDQTGLLLNVTDTYVDILNNEHVSRFYKPAQVKFLEKPVKKYFIWNPEEHDISLSGNFSELTWKPIYTLHMLDKVRLTLTAELLGGHFLPFTVDSIIFNTLPVVKESTMLRSMAMSAAVSAPLANIKTSYEFNIPTRVTSEMSIPLMSVEESVPTVYFLTIVPGNEVQYGYILDSPKYIPEGPVRVFNANGNLVGTSNVDVSGKQVRIKVAIEENVRTGIVVERSEKENRQNISFQITISSPKSITLIAELDFYGRLLESNPPINQRLSNKLFWYFSVPSGESVLTGTVTSEN